MLKPTEMKSEDLLILLRSAVCAAKGKGWEVLFEKGPWRFHLLEETPRGTKHHCLAPRPVKDVIALWRENERCTLKPQCDMEGLIELLCCALGLAMRKGYRKKVLEVLIKEFPPSEPLAQ